MSDQPLDFRTLHARVQRICLRFPEVEEKVDGFGHTTFRVRDKPFVMLGADEKSPSLSIKTLKTTQEGLLQVAGYKKTPYIGQHGWTTFPTLNIDWNEVEDFILEGYYRTAPKSLIKTL